MGGVLGGVMDGVRAGVWCESWYCKLQRLFSPRSTSYWSPKLLATFLLCFTLHAAETSAFNYNKINSISLKKEGDIESKESPNRDSFRSRYGALGHSPEERNVHHDRSLGNLISMDRSEGFAECAPSPRSTFPKNASGKKMKDKKKR